MPSRPLRLAGHGHVVVVVALCVAVAVSRLPDLSSPVSPDEGGFLTVGTQWAPGPSLYGHYWVDRPPLLIAVFALADALGGALSLRLIGVLAVAAAAGAAAVVGWLASGRRPYGAVGAATVAASFLGTPLFGTRVVDGELLASPLVLGGLAALLASYGTTTARAATFRLLAGGLGAAAFLVKQSMLDVLVVALVVAIHEIRRRGIRSGAALLLPILAGAAGTTVALTVVAVSRGTTVSGLWGAVVTFRFAADQVLGFSALRLSGLFRPYVVSGALAVTAVAAATCAGTRESADDSGPPWRTTAAVLCAWELTAVFAGGSYWTHYLIGLVPGLVLLVAVAFRTPHRVLRRLLGVTIGYAVLASAVSWGLHVGGPARPSDDLVAAAYLRDHAAPRDTVVVAFGHADIVHDSGLGSPYPYLWALPALVRDPRLTGLDRLLVSPAAPRWFVAGGNLGQWGRPGVVLQRTVDSRYVVALRTARWTVMRRR